MSALVIGEVLVDLVWRSGSTAIVPHPGGSPVNVAVGLQRLARSVHTITTWGDDPAGEMINDHLRSTGLSVHRAPSVSGRSAVALAYIDDATGAARYQFLASWDPTELPVPSGVTLLHTGSLALVVEPGAERVREAAQRVREQGGHVAIDLNVRPGVQPDRAVYRDSVRAAVRLADVVKASNEDLEWLWPDATPEESARALLKLGPQLAVVTLGNAGACAVTRHGIVHGTAPQVDVVDTIGAGDSFQAALLDGLMHLAHPDRLPQDEAALRRLLNRAATAGALACTRAGAQPPTREELDAAFERASIST